MSIFGWQLTLITSEANLWTNILPALILNGVFLMFVMATTAIQTFQEVQHNEMVFSSAQQVKNMLGQFGMAMGLAIATIISQWRTNTHYEYLSQHFVINDPTFTNILDKLTSTLILKNPNLNIDQVSIQILNQQLTQQSYLLASIDYFHCIQILGILGLLFILWQKTFK